LCSGKGAGQKLQGGWAVLGHRSIDLTREMGVPAKSTGRAGFRRCTRGCFLAPHPFLLQANWGRPCTPPDVRPIEASEGSCPPPVDIQWYWGRSRERAVRGCRVAHPSPAPVLLLR